MARLMLRGRALPTSEKKMNFPENNSCKLSGIVHCLRMSALINAIVSKVSDAITADSMLVDAVAFVVIVAIAIKGACMILSIYH